MRGKHAGRVRKSTRILAVTAVVLATVFNVMGSYLGAGLAMKRGAKIIRPMFLLVLALLFVRLLVTVIG